MLPLANQLQSGAWKLKGDIYKYMHRVDGWKAKIETNNFVHLYAYMQM